MNIKLVLRPAIGTGLVLLIPLVMTILDRHKAEGEGWRWAPGSFVVMGALLFGAGCLYESIAQRLSSTTQRVALGGAIALAVLAIWSELAVDAVSRGIDLLLG